MSVGLPSSCRLGAAAALLPYVQPCTAARWASSAAQPAQPAKIDFGNTATIHAHRSYLDLWRAYLVYQACSFPSVVQNADGLLSKAQRTLGASLVNATVKQTFFKHFCAGEDTGTIRPAVAALQARGVGAILDYAAEDDVSSEAGPASRADSSTRAVVGRTYTYESERQCDRHTDVFLNAVDTVAQMPGRNFAAIKVTALGNPALLERMSTALLSIRDLFRRFDIDGSGFIQEHEFRQVYSQLFKGAAEPEVAAAFQRLDLQHTGRVDYVSWTQKVRLKHMPYIAQRVQQSGAAGGEGSWQRQLSSECLTEEEVALVDAMMARVKKLGDAAASQGVRLMVDAEHSYFQPAIDHVASELMRRHNQEQPLIYTTYQCYLRDAAARLQSDMERARRGRYHFGCKLVRGAYMTLERERAAELGYEDPIWDTLQGTHDNYNRCVEMVLDEVKSRGAEVMIATHNQDSVERAIGYLQRVGLWDAAAAAAAGASRAPSGVYFGQLLGMADHLTFTLAQQGFRAFKYVPYGRVEQVMPYLIRRAQENSDVMSGAPRELRMLRSEIWRRTLQPLRALLGLGSGATHSSSGSGSSSRNSSDASKHSPSVGN